MSYVPDDLRYTKDHEWVRFDDTGIATCGITDYAQSMLEDIVFVELPETGRRVRQRDHIATIESERSVFEVHAPLSGKIVEVNSELEEAPEMINDDPYGDGWLFKIEAKGKGKMPALLDADEYQDHIAQLEQEEGDEEETEEGEEEFEY
ncbi:MAG: glycine cleavage system protein GcvH [Desulfobacterota bacterium]|nr:glycine cleavage system protein GcvH [Thermodesulfobacteriota bacterium]